VGTLTPSSIEWLQIAHVWRYAPVGRLASAAASAGTIHRGFLLSGLSLIVELDGPIHLRQIQQDQDRTQHFEEYGYRVLRFTNERIEHDLANVLKEIAVACQQ
jgi:very-short-patch-repair endonuclease